MLKIIIKESIGTRTIKEKFAEQVTMSKGDEFPWISCVPWEGAPTTDFDEVTQKCVDTVIHTETMGLLSYYYKQFQTNSPWILDSSMSPQV